MTAPQLVLLLLQDIIGHAANSDGRHIASCNMPTVQELQHNVLPLWHNSNSIRVQEISRDVRILPHQRQWGLPKVIVGLFIKEEQPVSHLERHNA